LRDMLNWLGSWDLVFIWLGQNNWNESFLYSIL